MTKKDLFQETFSCLHASDSIYAEVLNMAEAKRKPHSFQKLALLCTLTIIISGITVFAASQNGFFQSIFGPKGQKNVESHISPENNGLPAPARSWEEFNETALETLTDPSVIPLGVSVTAGGYTLTIHDYTMDESGIGAATYTLSNPDGLSEICYDEYGSYSTSEYSPLRALSMESTNGNLFNTNSIVDQTQTTDTKLHAVLYFAPFEKLDDVEGVRIILSIYHWDEHQELLSREEKAITFTPDTVLPTTVCASDSGYTAHLSPLGILLDGPIFEDQISGWYLQKLHITYADGSVYQVTDTDLANFTLSMITQSGGSIVVFNRWADMENVAAITINGPDGTDLVFTR